MNAALLPEISRSLSRSWQLLAGQALPFATDKPCPSLAEAKFYSLMIDGDPQAGHAAVLHISTPGLREVTATMFDMAADRLDERQLDDVGRELCNILGACCVEALRHDGESLTIGLPQSLSAHGLVDLLSRGSVLVQFVAVNIEGSPTVRVLRFQ